MTTLEQENRRLKQEVLLLQAELAQLKKLVFGARRERFVTDQNPNQGLLFEDSQAPEALVTEVKAVVAPATQTNSNQ